MKFSVIICCVWWDSIFSYITNWLQLLKSNLTFFFPQWTYGLAETTEWESRGNLLSTQSWVWHQGVSCDIFISCDIFMITSPTYLLSQSHMSHGEHMKHDHVAIFDHSHIHLPDHKSTWRHTSVHTSHHTTSPQPPTLLVVPLSNLVLITSAESLSNLWWRHFTLWWNLLAYTLHTTHQ